MLRLVQPENKPWNLQFLFDTNHHHPPPPFLTSKHRFRHPWLESADLLGNSISKILKSTFTGIHPARPLEQSQEVVPVEFVYSLGLICDESQYVMNIMALSLVVYGTVLECRQGESHVDAKPTTRILYTYKGT